MSDDLRDEFARTYPVESIAVPTAVGLWERGRRQRRRRRGVQLVGAAASVAVLVGAGAVFGLSGTADEGPPAPYVGPGVNESTDRVPEASGEGSDGTTSLEELGLRDDCDYPDDAYLAGLCEDIAEQIETYGEFPASKIGDYLVPAFERHTPGQPFVLGDEGCERIVVQLQERDEVVDVAHEAAGYAGYDGGDPAGDLDAACAHIEGYPTGDTRGDARWNVCHYAVPPEASTDGGSIWQRNVATACRQVREGQQPDRPDIVACYSRTDEPHGKLAGEIPTEHCDLLAADDDPLPLSKLDDLAR
jgi:hypothetical protein